MTYTQWPLWQAKWERYTNASGLIGVEAVHQLWEAMAETTQIDLIHEGAEYIMTVDDLLVKIQENVCK